MPSSKDRRRIELPSMLYERLAEIAKTEERTVTSLLSELLSSILAGYRAAWVPAEHRGKLTRRAQTSLALAAEEAKGLNHNYIGTEHLLLGLLREGEGIAFQVLTQVGVELAQVRSQIEEIIGRGDEPVSGELEYTPRTRRTLALAMEEARNLGHHYLGTEHLLLGIINEGNGVGASILESLGVTARARLQTFAVLRKLARSAKG